MAEKTVLVIQGKWKPWLVAGLLVPGWAALLYFAGVEPVKALGVAVIAFSGLVCPLSGILIAGGVAAIAGKEKATGDE